MLVINTTNKYDFMINKIFIFTLFKVDELLLLIFYWSYRSFDNNL